MKEVFLKVGTYRDWKYSLRRNQLWRKNIYTARWEKFSVHLANCYISNGVRSPFWAGPVELFEGDWYVFWNHWRHAILYIYQTFYMLNIPDKENGDSKFYCFHISCIHSFEYFKELPCGSSYTSNLWTLFHIFNTSSFPWGCYILFTYKLFWTQFTYKVLVHLLMNLILRDFGQKIQILSGPIFCYVCLNCNSLRFFLQLVD